MYDIVYSWELIYIAEVIAIKVEKSMIHRLPGVHQMPLQSFLRPRQGAVANHGVLLRVDQCAHGRVVLERLLGNLEIN